MPIKQTKQTKAELSQPTFYDLTKAEDELLSNLEFLLLEQQASDGDGQSAEQHEATLIDDLLKELDQAQEERDAKLDRLCAARRRLLADSESLKAEAQRIKARAERKEKMAEWIAQRIQTWMQTHGIESLETRSGANRIKLSEAGRAPVEVIETSKIESLPLAYLRIIPQTIELNKDAVYKALVAGLQSELFAGIVRLGQKTKRLIFS